MDEEADHPAAPPLVSLAPFSSSGRRLSSCFVPPSPTLSSPKQLAWISLQGRLVNSEEASSVRTIGGGLTRDQALAWELFTPIQRFLIVAVIGVAVAESKKGQQIWQLKKSVELRDQVLSSMQEKLDHLCEQVNNTKELSIVATKMLLSRSGELPLNETCGFRKADCGSWHSDKHFDLFNGLTGSSVTIGSSGNNLPYEMPFSNEEQEERRMSDMSWASSVTSAADIQVNTMALEQDFYDLKRDCEEKDAKVKNLTKRVAELEDIIRRKNTTITRSKKELVVLEQKVVQLSRLRRPSFSACDSHDGQPAHVRDNLLYDMESATSPSSSDSDSVPLSCAKNSVAKLDNVRVLNQNSASVGNQKSKPAKPSSSSGRAAERQLKSRCERPLQEVFASRKFNAASSRPNQFSVRGDFNKDRR